MYLAWSDRSELEVDFELNVFGSLEQLLDLQMIASKRFSGDYQICAIYKKSQTPQAKNLLSDDQTNDNQLYAKCLSIRKTYYDHLQTKQISFNDVAIKPIDFYMG